jgi:hypothetical protein
MAYKRKNGRRGSATIPFILPVIPRMARGPVHDSLLFRAAFQQPELYAPTPLTYDCLLSLHSAPTFSQGDIDLFHGLYQRLEVVSRDARIKKFKEGNRIHLQREINDQLRAAVKSWKRIWKKIVCIEDEEYNTSMDEVHLQWISHLIEHLREEVYLLSTTNRAHTYLTSVEARISM